ncbi:MAG: hypothetical protein QOG34_1949 [Frankiaceae bacterium]|jgi:DNA-binding NarL/FixJ family response regulator|nr:hypothetical protein [Frankiaceae bacterium]
MIRVLLVDDHPIFREGLAAALAADPDIRVVEGVGTAEAAIDVAPRLHPRVAIVDVQLPGMNGYDACLRLQRSQQIAVVLVSSTPTGIAVRRGLSVGCAGFVSKAAPPSTFREAVRAVASRRSFIDPALRRLADSSMAARLDIDARDQQLLSLLAQGLNNSEIAERLGYSRGTVKNRVSKLLQTMGARGRTDLVAIANQLAVVDPYPATHHHPAAQSHSAAVPTRPAPTTHSAPPQPGALPRQKSPGHLALVTPPPATDGPDVGDRVAEDDNDAVLD